MNRLSGAEAFVRMLQLHGVRHVFGLCGDTSLPLYDALYRLDHGITHVLARDERSAAYMADAYARVTGCVGVCEGPSGGGATYLLPGVVEANESSIPVLAVTTDIAVGARGRYVLTELDQEALFRPLAKWTRVIDRADQIPGAVRGAFRHMTTGRPGAAHIGLPFDVQRDPVDEAAVHADPTLGTYPARRAAPDPAAIETAAKEILSAERPLLICGGGPVIARAHAELAALADLLDAPVATTISGQGSLAEDHPLALGVVGSNGGTPATRALVEQADLVVFVGCRAGSVTTERWRHPAPGKARVVHIDVDPTVIGVNYPTEVAVVGDARLALAALGAEVARRQVPPEEATGRARVARAKAEKFATFQELARSDERPIRPERIVATLQELLASGCDHCGRRRHAVPVFFGVLRVPGGRPALHHQPGARRARLCPAGFGRRSDRPAGGAMRRGHGRRQLRFRVGRAGDDRPARPADHPGGDRKCHLRLGSRRARRAASPDAISRSISPRVSTPGSPRRTVSRPGGWRTPPTCGPRSPWRWRRARRPWSTSSPSRCTRRAPPSRSGWHEPARADRQPDASARCRRDSIPFWRRDGEAQATASADSAPVASSRLNAA